jgi:hypothetical protein
VATLKLGYDMWGRRLAAIGPVPLAHHRWRFSAYRLGEIPLGYDRGTRLRSIGPRVLEYDMLGNRRRWLDDWEFRYDRLGNRLRQIGPHHVTYRFGGRVDTIGPLRLEYRPLSTRPSRVRLPAALPELTEDLLVVLFLVLDRVVRHREAQRRMLRSP